MYSGRMEGEVRPFLLCRKVLMTKLNLLIENVNKAVWIVIGAILLGGVAIGDYLTGRELSFSFFYLIPIAFFSVTVRGILGIGAAFLSAGIWLFIEVMTANETSNSFVYLWNTLFRLGFFLLPAVLFRSIENEKLLARTDSLTGAINNRYFHELLQREIDRSSRYTHPFTIAFIDFDNFKTINDTFGHSFGDTLLRTFAEYAKSNLRKTDIVARVGGDEFAIILPETNEASARSAIQNLFQKLAKELECRKWPVTFSVGVLTFNTPATSVDKVLSLVDRMMYTVKNSGKNDIKFAAHTNN